MAPQNRTSTADSRKSDQQPVDDPRTQAEKFADLARELECDESEEGFDERLRGVASSVGRKGLEVRDVDKDDAQDT